jgi:hypothetical protein
MEKAIWAAITLALIGGALIIWVAGVELQRSNEAVSCAVFNGD